MVEVSERADVGVGSGTVRGFDGEGFVLRDVDGVSRMLLKRLTS